MICPICNQQEKTPEAMAEHMFGAHFMQRCWCAQHKDLMDLPQHLRQVAREEGLQTHLDFFFLGRKKP